MTTKKILQKARELITDPTNWTQNVTARDNQNFPVVATQRDACQWCAVGALARTVYLNIGFKQRAKAYLKAQQSLQKVIPEDTLIGTYNDNHTHQDILATFDKAIEFEERNSE